MLAKSLQVFVGIGVLVGLITGMYMAEIRENLMNAITITEGPSISVIPSKSSYDIGEEIAFRIINTGTVPLQPESGPYGATVTGLSGIVIYEFADTDITGHTAVQQPHTSVVLDNLEQQVGAGSNSSSSSSSNHNNNNDDYDVTDLSIPLLGRTLWPGDGIAISWDQIKNDGDVIHSGLYKINVDALADDTIPVDSDAPSQAANVTVSDSVTITIE